MPIHILSASHVFGFGQTSHTMLNADTNTMLNADTKKITKKINSLNSLSWIPLASMVVGIARIQFAYSVREKTGNISKAFVATNITRGAVETLGLGPLLLILDIIFTIGRHVTHSPKQTPPPPQTKQFQPKILKKNNKQHKQTTRSPSIKKDEDEKKEDDKYNGNIYCVDRHGKYVYGEVKRRKIVDDLD